MSTINKMGSGFSRFFLCLLSLTLTHNLGHAESLLDQKLRDQGNRLPKTIEELARNFGTANVVAVPDGRSRQAMDANDKNPRLLLGIDSQNESKNPEAQFNGRRFFVAIASQTGEIESISMNSLTGQFDFQVGMLNKKPSHDVSKRCVLCHQNRGPIFTPNPWQETGSSAAQRLDFKDKKNPTSVAGRLSKAHSNGQFHGLSIVDLGGTRSEKYDAHVRAANRLVQSRQFCQHACQGSLPCRKQLLSAALHHPDLSTFIDSGQVPKLADLHVSELNAHFERLPMPVDFSYSSSVIPDRDPTLPEGKNVFRPDFNQKTPIRDVASPTEKVVNNSEFGAPSTPRPKVGGISKKDRTQIAADVSFECLGFDWNDRGIIQKCSDDQIDQILNSTKIHDALLSDWKRALQGQSPRGSVRHIVMEQVSQTCSQTKNSNPTTRPTHQKGD